MAKMAGKVKPTASNGKDAPAEAEPGTWTPQRGLELRAKLAASMLKGALEDCIFYRGRVYRAVEIAVEGLSAQEKHSYAVFCENTRCFPHLAIVVENAVSVKDLFVEESEYYNKAG